MTENTVVHIGECPIGVGHPTFLIAEVAQAHDGSLGLAHAFIDVAADAGADAIKLQTHIASAESTLDEPFRVAIGRQDATRYAYWQRMEFTPEQWAGLAEHASERHLVFLSSAFSLAAVEVLKSIGMPAWKVGSGEFASFELLDAMCETGAPVLLSTGMSTFCEIDTAVERIHANGARCCVLQCTSAYPTSLDRVGLNVINELRARYQCPVGLSDHSGTVFPSLAAMATGVDVLEVHLTLDRTMFGPDVSSSVTPEEFRQISAARDAFRILENNPVDKDGMTLSLKDLRETFTKSITPLRALSEGTQLTEAMLTLKKPGAGIPRTEMHNVVGRTLARAVSPDRLLRWEDLDG